jgi:HK97 family phage major capsid protein
MERLSELTRAVSSLPKGTAFVRLVQALAQAKNDIWAAAAIAERKSEWRSTPEVGAALKAAMSASTTIDSDNAAPLVAYQTIAAEFVELLRGLSVVSRIQRLRRVPFDIRVSREPLASTTVAWVGEPLPAPAGEAAFDELVLGRAKVAGIVALTSELSRSSSQSAVGFIRSSLAGAIAAFVDRHFLDPQYVKLRAPVISDHDANLPVINVR